MTLVFRLILVLHLVGWAIVLGGTLTNLRVPRFAPGVLHGALTALVTGIVMVLLLATGAVGDGEPEFGKYVVKLVLAGVATGLVVAGTRRPEATSRAHVAGTAGIVVVIVAISVLWR